MLFLVFSIHLSIRPRQAAHMAPPWHAGAGGHSRRQSQPSSACRQRPNGSAGIRQGLPSGLAKRAVPPCKTAHAALPNGTYRKAERPVLQRQGGQPRNPLQARLFAEAGPWAPRPHATPAAEAKRPRPRPPTAGHNKKQRVPRLTTQHPQKIRIYLYHIAISL